MKKICFICFNIEDMGGITRVVSNLCKEIYEDYSVSIISICNTNKEPHYEFSDKIKIHKLNNNPDDRIKNIILKSFSELKTIFKNEKFDIIFMEGHYIPPIVLPLRFFTKSKFVFCDHGALSNQLSDKKATIFRRIGAIFSDKTVVLTESTKKEYIDYFKIKEDKILVIPNFIDDSIFNFENVYNEDSKLILSSGRFTSEKGFDMLVDVAKELFKNHKEWQWHIFGDGPEFEKINSKIKELNLGKNVKLMGLADNMYDKYKNYGIFVLTSYREGFSLVLLEAKANSLPLVSFDCVAGPSEIISNNVDGYLIPCYNIEMMSKKISELINKSDLRKKFSTNSQLNVDKFKKSAIIEKWKRIIDEL